MEPARFRFPAHLRRDVPIEQVLAVAEAAYMPKGQPIVAPFNPVVVNTGAKLVLINSGYGTGIAPTVGLLSGNLAAAGIDPKTIDIVLISHMHGDHILRLKHPDGSASVSPNAEIKVSAVDWAFWMSDDNMSKAPEGLSRRVSFEFNRKIFSNLADRVTRFEWDGRSRPRHNRPRHERTHPGPRFFRHRVGFGAAAFPRRCQRRPGSVPAQSRLAGDVRQRAGEGGAGEHVSTFTTWLSAERTLITGLPFSRSPASVTSRRLAWAFASCRPPGIRPFDWGSIGRKEETS